MCITFNVELWFCSVTIHFKFPDGSRKTANAKVGENLLDAVLTSNLDIDGYGMHNLLLLVIFCPMRAPVL